MMALAIGAVLAFQFGSFSSGAIAAVADLTGLQPRSAHISFAPASASTSPLVLTVVKIWQVLVNCQLSKSLACEIFQGCTGMASRWFQVRQRPIFHIRPSVLFCVGLYNGYSPYYGLEVLWQSV